MTNEKIMELAGFYVPDAKKVRGELLAFARAVLSAEPAAAHEPIAYVRQSELDALANPHVAGRGMMLHKTQNEGMVPVYVAPVTAAPPVGYFIKHSEFGPWVECEHGTQNAQPLYAASVASTT